MRLFSILPLVMFFLLGFGGISTGFAQEQNISIDKKQLGSLIETLESEEKRTAFIENLKTLAAVDQTEEEPLSISQLLGLEKPFQALHRKYVAFLDKYDINDSSFSNMIATAVILLGALFLMYLNYRLSLYIQNKLIALKNKFGLPHDRIHMYTRILRSFGHLIILLTAVFMIALNWGINLQQFQILKMLNFPTIFSIVLIVLSGIIVWEVIDGAIELMKLRAPPRRKARIGTLAPIIHNIALIVFLTMFFMILLAQMGVNVLPLLAGAGILGIAIGFGAQSLVKDYISGFFILFEDLIQTGDVVSLAGHTGSIERITIRKVQLRDFSGSVYTIPFGEVTTIQNMTKDFSFYPLDIGVGYGENIDDVIGYIREVDEEIRADNAYKDLILEPIDIVGLDRFADSAVIIKARLKTLPSHQWAVGRAFNRLLKYKFDEQGVEMPFPSQTVYMAEDKTDALKKTK